MEVVEFEAVFLIWDLISINHTHLTVWNILDPSGVESPGSNCWPNGSEVPVNGAAWCWRASRVCFNRLVKGLQASRPRQNGKTKDENKLIVIVEDSCEPSSLSTLT